MNYKKSFLKTFLTFSQSSYLYFLKQLSCKKKRVKEHSVYSNSFEKQSEENKRIDKGLHAFYKKVVYKKVQLDPPRPSKKLRKFKYFQFKYFQFTRDFPLKMAEKSQIFIEFGN